MLRVRVEGVVKKKREKVLCRSTNYDLGVSRVNIGFELVLSF